MMLKQIFGFCVSLAAASAACIGLGYNHPIEKSGQKGWSHDEGYPSGYFHTYDSLKVAGSNDSPRKIHIFLPKNYEETQEKFPVVYMNNGDISFFSNSIQGSKENLRVANAIGKLNAQGRSHQPIVVAIYPLNASAEYSLNVPNSGQCCGVAAYANYVADHVKRFVDNNYRTLREPENTTVLGVSTGANAAILQMALRPDAFLNVAAISPPVWREASQANFNQSEFVEMLNYTFQTRRDTLKIYLDWGASSLAATNNFDEGSEEQRTAFSASFLKDYLIDTFGLKEGKNIEWQEDKEGTGTISSWSQRIFFALTPFIKWR